MRKHKWVLIIPITLILLQLRYTPVASSANTSDNWTMFLHDPSHNSCTTCNISSNSTRTLWAFKTWKPVKSSPAVAHGYLLVGSRNWRIYCLNPSTGKQLWNYSTGNEVNSSPAINNGSVYVGSDDGYVYRLDVATGMLFWRRSIGGLVRSSPAVVAGRVYVGSGAHDIFCLNASDGTIIWSHPTSNRVNSSPAVSNGVVYVATDDFFAYALNASTGREVWRRHTGSTSSSPCVYNGSVYIGSTDGYICALNASTGTKIWQHLTDGSVFSSPAVAYGRVYVGSDDNNVYCLNASNGHKMWQRPTGYWVRSSPAVADGNVYVGSEDFNIYCFDAFTGAKKWSCATGSSVDSSPAIADGNLYIGSCDYSVYAFALGNSTAGALPSQFTNAFPWTTVVFDAIAFALGTAITLTTVRFIRSTKQDTDVANTSHRKPRWFSAHTEAICVLAILVFSAMFFLNLGSGPLWATDEQTYSQWAYHMFKTGNYLTPWTFGQLEIGVGKPPLFMWLMSLAYQIFGVNNFASRFWSPVFGALSLVVVFYLGRKLYNSFVGFLSALVLGTFTTFYLFARHAMTDVTFIFFTLASVYFLLLNEKSEGSNRCAALAGLFLGLAFLTKQLEAFLIPLIIFSYFIATRRGMRFFFTKRFALFWQAAFLVASPWVIYMILRFGPDFWQSYFVFSGVTRLISPIEGHVEGYLYYFSYLFTKENLLWVILLPISAGLCAFNAVAKRSKEDTLVFVWMTVVLVFFTFAQTKLFWYILPAFPAFAIAISSFVFQMLKRMQLSMHYVYRSMNRIVSHIPSAIKKMPRKASPSSE
jgi:outer membrane protein assembly factor BamB